MKFEFTREQIVILLEGLSLIMDSSEYPKETKEIAEECTKSIENVIQNNDSIQ